MKNLKSLGVDLAIARKRVRKNVGVVAAPDEILDELHGIPFRAGERVIDQITGEEVEVVGSGIQNVEASE